MLVRESREENGAKGRVGKGSDQVWEDIDARAVDVKRLTDKVIIVSRTFCALPAFSQRRIDTFSHVHQYILILFSPCSMFSVCVETLGFGQNFSTF